MLQWVYKQHIVGSQMKGQKHSDLRNKRKASPRKMNSILDSWIIGGRIVNAHIPNIIIWLGNSYIT